MPIAFARGIAPLLALAIAAAVAQPAAAQPKPADSDPVVAVVNGRQILRSELDLYMETLPPQMQQVPLAMIFPQVIERVVARELIAQAARADGMQNEAEFKKRMAFIESGVLQQAYLYKLIEKEVTEASLRAAHQKEVAGQGAREELRARHILVRSKEEAEGVIKDLAKGGDFAKLAAGKSIDPGGQAGGDLGWFTKDKMVAAFADAAFAMKKGETSKAPVQSEFGWHVIRVEDRRTAQPRSFEDAAEELREAQTGAVVRKAMEDLRGKAKVEVFNPDGSKRP
ncbi:MAG: peptidylprolyl isomerase [Alphaproteobacteria bacterium]|nr:peptidylprolyl isomerase [Alphaproteobacteria bacterium]